MFSWYFYPIETMGVFDSIRKKRASGDHIAQKCAISLASGQYEMRPPDINLWCIGSDCKPCVVVIPLQAWERMHSIIMLTSQEQWKRLSSTLTEYSHEQSTVVTVTTASGEDAEHKAVFAATCGFRRLYTDTPILVPVLISLATMINLFAPLEHYIRNRSTPPESLAQGLLEDAEFIESDQTLCIPLTRRSRSLSSYDKFSRFPNGDKIEIFETYTSSS